jgi:hypothetical protein
MAALEVGCKGYFAQIGMSVIEELGGTITLVSIDIEAEIFIQERV